MQQRRFDFYKQRNGLIDHDAQDRERYEQEQRRKKELQEQKKKKNINSAKIQQLQYENVLLTQQLQEKIVMKRLCEEDPFQVTELIAQAEAFQSDYKNNQEELQHLQKVLDQLTNKIKQFEESNIHMLNSKRLQDDISALIPKINNQIKIINVQDSFPRIKGDMLQKRVQLDQLLENIDFLENNYQQLQYENTLLRTEIKQLMMLQQNSEV